MAKAKALVETQTHCDDCWLELHTSGLAWLRFIIMSSCGCALSVKTFRHVVICYVFFYCLAESDSSNNDTLILGILRKHRKTPSHECGLMKERKSCSHHLTVAKFIIFLRFYKLFSIFSFDMETMTQRPFLQMVFFCIGGFFLRFSHMVY